MKLNITKEGHFIPTWKGNDKSDEPIEIFYIRLSGNDMTRTMKFAGAGEMSYDIMEICKRCITDIKNLEVNGEVVITGEQLTKIPKLHGLCMQVATHIISDSDLDIELEKKN